MAVLPARTNLIVTLGQSLNSAPDASGPLSLFGLIKAHYANVARTERGHIAGIAWLQWVQSPGWSGYYKYWATKAERVIFAMCGGTTDYSTVANRTGAECYGDQVGISTLLRAFGSQVKIIGSTTNPSTDMTGALTSVASGSSGVLLSSFAGSGTLNVKNTAAKGSNSAFTTSGTVKIGLGTTTATVTYTGKSGTTLTGCTTTAGSGTLAEGMQVAQGGNAGDMVDGNALVMADASTAFDRKVDYASTVPLDDPSNTTYYGDGTHPTALGNTFMFAALQPAIDALLI